MVDDIIILNCSLTRILDRSRFVNSLRKVQMVVAKGVISDVLLVTEQFV